MSANQTGPDDLSFLDELLTSDQFPIDMDSDPWKENRARMVAAIREDDKGAAEGLIRGRYINVYDRIYATKMAAFNALNVLDGFIQVGDYDLNWGPIDYNDHVRHTNVMSVMWQELISHYGKYTDVQFLNARLDFIRKIVERADHFPEVTLRQSDGRWAAGMMTMFFVGVHDPMPTEYENYLETVHQYMLDKGEPTQTRYLLLTSGYPSRRSPYEEVKRVASNPRFPFMARVLEVLDDWLVANP